MVDKTLDELTTEVQSAIFQAAGLNVQVYSEDIIQRKIINAFIMFASDPDYSWKRFDTYTTRTLDGSGYPTVSLATVFNSFDDISNIYPSGSNRPLVSGSIPGNPLLPTGTTPASYIFDTAHLIRVIPITSTGDIVVVGKTYPVVFQNTDTVPFDYIALSSYVAWQYMVDDGANPQSAEVFRQQFETRMKQLKKLQDQAPIAINGNTAATIPSQWFSE